MNAAQRITAALLALAMLTTSSGAQRPANTSRARECAAAQGWN